MHFIISLFTGHIDLVQGPYIRFHVHKLWGEK